MMRALAIAAASIACASAPQVDQRRFLYRDWLEAVKARIGEAWVARVTRATEANDPTGCRYSTKDRRTVLSFTVAADGTVTDATVASSCGVRYLDLVAVDAIRSVAKVEPPPSGMLEGRPEVELPFAFTLQARQGDCNAPDPQRR